MTITNKQKAILHVAKSKVDITDEEYRAALIQVSGVTSSTELDQAGFEAMMGLFEHLGFRPLVGSGAPDYGKRTGMASFAQLELIRTLWAEWTRGKGTDAGLNHWIERTFGITSLRFMTKLQGQKAITALKCMKARVA